MQKQYFCVLAALLSSASLQEEKQGLQKDAISDGSSTKISLYQDERETIPTNKFGIKKKKESLCIFKITDVIVLFYCF